MTITMTESAAEAIKRLANEQGKPGLGLRFGVAGGGCSGYSYLTRLEENPRENDIVLEKNGARVFVDPKSLKVLEGTNIDYVESLAYTGFKFENPKAQSSCGCGISFSVS